jgi:hypothetical protein
LFHSSTAGYEPKEEKRVLFLFPGQSDLAAYPLVEKGIKSSLKAGTEFRIEYFIEYMDRYRNSNQTHYQQLLDLYRHKYSGKKSTWLFRSVPRCGASRELQGMFNLSTTQRQWPADWRPHRGLQPRPQGHGELRNRPGPSLQPVAGPAGALRLLHE